MTISLHDYDISFGKADEILHSFLEQQTYTQIAVLVDENTHEFCLPKIQTILNHFGANIILIQSGEIHKNLETCDYIWQQMIDYRFDRRSLLLNLGGGVIGDMGGFCAATFKRGLDFVQIPTTLLAQVDASVGGKLGIDLGGIKNCVGVFQSPRRVLIDADFLQTLPARELRSGFAEIVKHALIGDKKSWEKLKTLDKIQTSDLQQFIFPSLALKKNIVETDPFEQNIRKALNFGHTIGHAVESYFLETDSPLLHGEAIAVGMICEAHLSHRLCGLSAKELDDICRFVNHFFPKITISVTIFPQLLSLMYQDKKNEYSAINCSLISGIGQAKINQICSEVDLLWAISQYQKNG